jgi:hypothetical protein
MAVKVYISPRSRVLGPQEAVGNVHHVLGHLRRQAWLSATDCIRDPMVAEYPNVSPMDNPIL